MPSKSARLTQQKPGTQRRDPKTSTTAKFGSSAALARPTGSPGEILELQRLAGNQAVTDMILQRDDLLAPALAPTAPPAKGPVPGTKLTHEERQELVREAGLRIGLAYNDFGTACMDNKAALAAEAAERAEMIALIADIATGFLAPGLGRVLSHQVEKVAEKVESKLLKAALKRAEAEALGKVFESAVKVGSNVMKSNYAALSGEKDSDAFINGLQMQFHRAAQEIDDHLPQMSDEELIVTCAAYDVEVANLNTYRAALKEVIERFQQQIHEIGSFSMQANSTVLINHSKVAYYVAGGADGLRLALLEKNTITYGSRPITNYEFQTWITPDMTSLAFAKMKDYGGVQTVDVSEVSGLPSR